MGRLKGDIERILLLHLPCISLWHRQARLSDRCNRRKPVDPRTSMKRSPTKPSLCSSLSGPSNQAFEGGVALYAFCEPCSREKMKLTLPTPAPAMHADGLQMIPSPFRAIPRTSLPVFSTVNTSLPNLPKSLAYRTFPVLAHHSLPSFGTFPSCVYSSLLTTCLHINEPLTSFRLHPAFDFHHLRFI